MSDVSRALSYAQLKSALWSRSGARVHAVIDGLAVPGLPAKLAAADVSGWDCLERGALSPADAERAPYVVELRESSPFTDWLLGAATAAHPQWGVVIACTEALLRVREWCRDLSTVVTPDGGRRAFRWFDPEVLQTLLPALSPSQLDTVFRLDQSLVLPAADAWTWHAMHEGVLAAERRALMADRTAP